MMNTVKIHFGFFVIFFIISLVLITPYNSNPSISFGFGLICFFLAFFNAVFFVIKINKNLNILSSSLSPFYKFILPIGFFILFFFNAILIAFHLYPGNNVFLFYALQMMFFFWIVFSIPSMKLHAMSIKQDKIILNNYFEEFVFLKKDLISIKSYMFFYYKIKLKNSEFIVEPKVREVLNPFKENSLKKLAKNGF